MQKHNPDQLSLFRKTHEEADASSTLEALGAP